MRTAWRQVLPDMPLLFYVFHYTFLEDLAIYKQFYLVKFKQQLDLMRHKKTKQTSAES